MEITKENIKELVGRRFVPTTKQNWEGIILHIDDKWFNVQYSDQKNTSTLWIETAINAFKKGEWLLLLNKEMKKPNHYPQSYDVIDFVKDNDLNFNEGNVIKYVVRCRKKGTHLQDLQKAKDYLEREIDYLTKKELQK